jgi:hypothetical protein
MTSSRFELINDTEHGASLAANRDEAERVLALSRQSRAGALSPLGFLFCSSDLAGNIQHAVRLARKARHLYPLPEASALLVELLSELQGPEQKEGHPNSPEPSQNDENESSPAPQPTTHTTLSQRFDAAWNRVARSFEAKLERYILPR